MFFRKPSRQKPNLRAPRRFRLEALEARNCLSTSPLGLSLMAQTAGYPDVSVSGQVYNPAPNCQVTLSGAVNTTVLVDSSGDFGYVGPASGLGTITATASDSAGDSGQASSDIMDPPPSVNNLQAMPTGQGQQVDISGSVSADNAAGLTVKLSGAGLQATSAITDENGNFDLLTTAKSLGTVTAIVTDDWGVQSPVATTTLTVPPPTISGLTAVNLGNGEWEFEGSVSGPDVTDDSVQLSGLASAGATPDANGYFSVIVDIGTNPSGSEYAVATDIWGQTSNQAEYSFLY